MLQKLRKDVDKIDEQILFLLVERLKKTKEISKYKKSNSVPEVQKEREEDIIEKVKKLGKGKLREEYIEDIFKRIIQESHSKA